MDGSRDSADRFVKMTGLRAPTVVGTAQLAAAYNMAVYPWTVIIDRTGTAVYAIRGARTESELRQAFERFL
jgi:hypothetical protein